MACLIKDLLGEISKIGNLGSMPGLEALVEDVSAELKEYKSPYVRKPKVTRVSVEPKEVLKKEIEAVKAVIAGLLTTKQLRANKNKVVLSDGTEISKASYLSYLKDGGIENKEVIDELGKYKSFKAFQEAHNDGALNPLSNTYDKAMLKRIAGYMDYMQKVMEGKRVDGAKWKKYTSDEAAYLEMYENNIGDVVEPGTEYEGAVNKYKEKYPTLDMNVGEITVGGVVTEIADSAEVLGDIVESIVEPEEEVQEEYYTELEQKLAEVETTIKGYKTQVDMLESKLDVVQKEIENQKGIIKKISEEITTYRDATDKGKGIPDGLSLSGIVSFLKSLPSKIGKLIELIKEHRAELAVKKEARDALREEIAMYKEAIEGQRIYQEQLRMEYTGIETMQWDAKGGAIGSASIVKNKNKGAVVGLTGKLLGTKSVEDSVKSIMGMMPRLIKNSGEVGVERVTEAVNTWLGFNELRASIPMLDQSKMKLEDNESIYDANILVRYGFDRILAGTGEKTAKAAMNTATLVMYSKIAAMQTANQQSLEDTVDGMFGNLFPENYGRVPETYRERLVSLVRSGDVVPVTLYASAAGKVMLNELEKKFERDVIPKEDRMAIEAALGTLVMNNMVQVGQGKGNGPVRQVLALDDMGYPIVRGADATAKGAAVVVLDFRRMGKKTREAYRKAGGVFEFAQHKDAPMISLEPIVTKEDSMVRNANVAKGKAAVGYMNKQQGMAWKFGKEFQELIKGYDLNSEADVDRLKSDILGDLDSKLAKTSTLKAESVHSKYKADELQIERMLDIYNMVGDQEFYIPWDYTVSNRNMVDSMWINPQNSKISRFLVGAKGMVLDEVALDESYGTNNTVWDYIEVAATQALDLGLDKKPDSVVLKDLHDKYFERVKGKVVIKNAKFEAVVNNPTLEAINKWHPHMNIAEKMHILQLAQLLNQVVVQGKDVVSTSMALEVDGITNGMSSMLMQMGFNKYTTKMVAKTGVYTGDSKYKNHGEYKAEGNTDIYETPKEAIVESLNEDNEALDTIETIIAGKWRNFLKGPVMVFIYGASMKNIRKNLATSLIAGNSYIDGGVALGKMAEVLKLAGIKESEVGAYVKYGQYDAVNGRVVEIEDIDTYLAEKFPEGTDPEIVAKEKNRLGYLSETSIEYLAKKIDARIGAQIEKAFEDETRAFGPIVEFRRALKIVDQMNYIIFKTRVAEKVYGLGKSRLSELTDTQIEKVYKETMDEGLYYGVENSVGGIQDYVKLEKMEGEGTYKIRVNMAEYQANGGTGNIANTARYIQELVANVGAVGVTTVHSIDGSVMIEGHTEDVLNIYDALMLGVNPAVNGKQVQGMNKSFLDINARHSILGKSVKKLVKSLTNPDIPVNFDIIHGDKEYATILSDFQRIMAEYDLNKLMDQLNPDKLMGSLEKFHKDRKAMEGTRVLTNQYYATDLVDGHEEIIKQAEGIFEDGKEHEQAVVVRNALQMMLDATMKGAELKGEAKQKNSIIREVLEGLELNEEQRVQIEALLDNDVMEIC